MSGSGAAVATALFTLAAGIAVYCQHRQPTKRKPTHTNTAADDSESDTEDDQSTPVASDADLVLLADPFAGPSLPAALTWFCPPASSTGSWSIQPSTKSIVLRTDSQTDFWRRTHYGFSVDNGHCLLAHVAGDFVVQARILAHPQHQYDQAGLIVRSSAGSSCWLKTSVEYEPAETSRLGAVVTNFGYSDWSTQAFEPIPTNTKRAEAGSTNASATSQSAVSPPAIDYWLRIRREADDYIVDSSLDGARWTQIRMAHLHESRGQPVRVGLYACSPKENGFEAAFSQFSVRRGRIAIQEA